MAEDTISHRDHHLIYSSCDSAGIDGSFLYGGQLDKCKLDSKIITSESPYMYYFENGRASISNFTGEAVSSEPYRLCFCTKSDPITIVRSGCTTIKSVETHRGQTFSVLLVAIGQGGAITQAKVTATPLGNSRLEVLQTTQKLDHSCSKLNYTLYSTEAHATLELYLHGPCEDIRLANVVIDVTFLPCPAAFALVGEECVCEERLHQYNVSCTLGDQFSITRKAGATFWMGVVYSNGSYRGLILCSTCPSQYCRSDGTNITLEHLDTQCALNRSGVLCGACATNYSLLLGGSRCGLCTNAHLALLLPMACAGLSLVALLTFLKLTVATGMLNSLILYANKVQVNRNLLFPTSDSVNVLTVFVAWLNLDLGFQTCFYDGMDAFAQTSIQFAFPVYTWIIISLIILSSRYSSLVSKLIGSNPIAVLATLLLMSYTKILKIAIDIYSSVMLDYPDNLKITAWSKDANEPYLRSRHLFLTVTTSLVLVFLFLPYTLLLLFGFRLYRFMGRKNFHWLSRLKPLLDAYYAQFNRHTRYWTGLLLLVRCALYVVFSYNSLGGTSKSLLAIIVTFTAIVAKVWFSGKIYRNLYVNIVEVSMHLNLIILSAATLARVNTPPVVYLLVGVVFVTMLGIVSYYFHLLYIAKTAVWLKVKTMILSSCHLLRRHLGTTLPPQDEPQQASSCDPHQIVSKTVIELREPLLELS